MNNKLIKPKLLFSQYRNHIKSMNNYYTDNKDGNNKINTKISSILSKYQNNQKKYQNTTIEQKKQDNSLYSRNYQNQYQHTNYNKNYFTIKHIDQYNTLHKNNQQTYSSNYPPRSQSRPSNKQSHYSQYTHQLPYYHKKKSHSVSLSNNSYDKNDYIQYLKKKNRSYLPSLKQQKPKLFFLEQQPVLSLKSVLPNKNKYSQRYKKRLKTQNKPLKNVKVSRKQSYRSLKSCSDVQINSIKLTDKYISRLNNIKFVQRLLLIKPSNQVRRDSHQKFYAQQTNLKNRISRMSNTSSSHKIKIKKQIKRKRLKKAWE